MRPRKPWIGLFFFLFVVISLVIALWQYHQMIIALYDGASASVYRRLLRPLGSSLDGFGQKPIRIALWHSDVSAEVLGAPPHALEEWTRQWERFLARERFAYRRLSGLSLDAVSLGEYNVLILPTVVAMSDGEIEAVKRFLRLGNGVFLMWAAGTRTEGGAWRSSPLLQQVCGLELGDPVPEGERPGQSFAVFSNRTPMTRGMPPAWVMSLARYDQPLSARVREPRTEVIGAWVHSDRWVPRLRAHGEAARDRAVMVHGEYRGGRFVWMGFPLAAASRPDQQPYLDLLVRQSIAWLGRQAIAYKPLWPENAGGAFALSWCLDHGELFDEQLARLMAEYHIRLTSFVTPNVLDESPAWLSRLTKMGTIGLWLPPPPDRSLPPPMDDLVRWHRMLAQLNDGRPIGIRLAWDDIPDPWFEALVRVGYSYISAWRTPHLLPRVVRTYRAMPIFVRERELWMLPDLALSELEGAPARVPQEGLEGTLSRIAAEGGFLHLVLHADHVNSTTLRRLDSIIATAKRDRLWVTDVDSIFEYYRIWGHLRVSTDYPTPNRTDVMVSNTGARYSGDLTVYLRLEDRVRTLDLRPATLGSPPVQPFSEDGRLWRFDLPRVPPGKNYQYQLFISPSAIGRFAE